MAKPERLKTESPVAYYERTRCCPDDFMEPHEGLYYCNPAHCKQTWTDEEARDRHVSAAYAMLG